MKRPSTWLPDDLLVTHPERWRRAWLAASLPFAVGIACLAVVGPVHHWYQMVAGSIVGGLLGWFSLGIMRRLRAYQAGWIIGRGEMVMSLTEAIRRGMTLEEWLHSQVEKDGAMLGMPVPPFAPKDAEGNDV